MNDIYISKSKLDEINSTLKIALETIKKLNKEKENAFFIGYIKGMADSMKNY